MLNQSKGFTKLISFVLVLLFISANMLINFSSPALAGNGNVNGNNSGTVDNRVIYGTYIDCTNNQYQCGNTESMLDDAVGQLGYLAGVAGDIAAISGMGAVSGLSGAGITSGLAAIGSIVGGGMLAGVVVTVAAPVAASIAAGTAIHYLSNRSSKDKTYVQAEE